ncbi:MAG TPA: hypothetical protein V6C81_12995 [Planktothrix sp.]|jgi:hypothetical protein
MANKATATSPLRLLLNAEPFGFGPAAAIADCFPHLRKSFARLAYVGSGHTLDLQRRLPYDAVHEVKPGDDGALESIFSQYDLMLTALDFGMAAAAEKAGLPVCIYDPLTWYWKEIHPAASRCRLYIAQDFYGVKERLHSEAEKFAAPQVVQPLLPSTVPWRGKREHVLLNLGGLSNPLWGNEETVGYARLIVSSFCQAIDGREKVIIAGNSLLARELKEFGATNFSREEMQEILHKAKYALMTPGLGNIYDAARFSTPTIWLPPANDSQAQQRILLGVHDRSDGSLDWSQFVTGAEIDYHGEQSVILSQIAAAVKRANASQRSKKQLVGLMAQLVKSIDTKVVGAAAGLLYDFGWDGAKQVAELVVQQAQRLSVPKSRTSPYIDLGLPGDLRVRVKHPQKIFASEATRLLAGAYVPGFSLHTSGYAREKADLTISFHESRAKRLKVEGKQIELHDRWSGDGSTLDLLHLIHSAARLHWLRRGLYSVHSSCVGNDSGHALIVGHSGVGKTSIALELVKRGMKLYSGNKTLVSVSADGAITAHGGTRTITTRAQDVTRHEAAADGVGYSERCAFLLDPDQYSADATVNIKLIVLAKLNPGTDDFTRQAPGGALHRLYPYFLDTVNADTVLCDGHEVFSGSPPTGCQRRLSTTLSVALGKIPVYSMTGSMEYITATLERELCPTGK